MHSSRKDLNNNKPIELQNKLNLSSNIHYAKQEHSDKVIEVNNRLNLKSKIADSLITKEQFQSLWIYTADCIPILIADIKTRNIAACHSGLKGIKKQLISKTLKKLKKIGSKKNNLIIAIGPSITGDKYQVNKKDVEGLIFNYRALCKKFIHKRNQRRRNNSLIQEDSNPNKILFDIQAAAIAIIQRR